ncbi:MAG: L,D-transpeptidase family protein [Xanthobacteraceae bacterium]
MRFDRLLAGSAIALVLAASVSARAGDTGVSAEAGLAGTLNIAGGRTIRQPTFASASQDQRSAPAKSTAASIDSQVPMIEPAEVVITAEDIGLSTKTATALAEDQAAAANKPALAETDPPADSTSQPIRLTSIPGARVEANADPDAIPSLPIMAPKLTSQPTGRVPMIEPADVTITADDIARAKTETNQVDDKETRLTSIPGGQVEANADPDATSSITAVTPAISLTPATPASSSPAVTAPPSATTTPAATTPAATPPAAPMPPQLALSPFGEKLRDLMAGDEAKRMLSSDDLSSLSNFYAAHNFEPLWTDKGVMTDRAKAALAQLKSADDDGLDPADYRVPALEANASEDALASFELKLTNAVVDYAHHAAVGRVHWSRVARDIVYQTEPPAAADILTKLSTATDARAALDSYNPQHKHYKALKAKLAELRGKKDKVEEEQIEIGPGPMLRAGMVDERVPDLRKRLKVAGAEDGQTYDAALEDAVKAFQKDHGLLPDGLLGPNTVRALNGKTTERGGAHTVDVVLANLERWRWMPHDLGESHVIVNIPEFMLRVYHKGSLHWQTRVVVGKPSTPTPLLTETMKFITVNPTWNVPPSIVYGEYLPALQQDPTALSRMGLRVSYGSGGGVRIWQPPGPANALGRIRFNFPNKFLVYQHDTPDKYMFKHDRRAYSHGCMRVMDPDQYAEALLSIALPEKNYTAAGIRSMYGRGEVNINFPEPIPVHLTYQTAYVDSAGKLKLSGDVYGRDSRTIAALKSDNVRIASPAPQPARRSTRIRRQVYREPVQQRGFNFFGLFR